MLKFETLENLIKLRRFQPYPKKENAISFWAFLFSIIFYISIFCMFNIQPSTIINTTKFWFFISNTLILIIAADFSAFSSSKKHIHMHEEYVKIPDDQETIASSFETHYAKVMVKIEEKIKDVVVYEKGSVEVLECDNNIKIIYDLDEPSATDSTPGISFGFNLCARDNSTSGLSIKKNAINEGNEEKEMLLERSRSEKYDEQEGEDHSEWSTMSIEELNRRAEEFIQRINREIRLQAAASKKPKF